MSGSGPKAAAMALVVLFAAGAHRAAAPKEKQPAKVAVNGVTLASDAITLPDDSASFPAGADGELVTQNCTACHSAELILSQPKLPPEAWAAEVKKMREAYHAPVAETEDKGIVAALVRLQGAGR